MERGKIRVLVVDHNPLIREGLSVLIRLQLDMELTATVASGEEAVRVFGDHRPDITLMDLDLPSAAGIKAIEEIRTIEPNASVLGMFTYEWDQTTADAMRAGCWACLAKDKLNVDLVALIRGRTRRNG